MFRLASVDLLELDAPTTHLARFLPSLTCGPVIMVCMCMLDNISTMRLFFRHVVASAGRTCWCSRGLEGCVVSGSMKGPSEAPASLVWTGAVALDRKSKAPFTFALQLMVPGPPYRALVIAWAADLDPSALAEAAAPRAGDASCADDDSDSELAPFELALARCAQLAEVGYHCPTADGIALPCGAQPSSAFWRTDALRCDGAAVSNVK